MRALRHSFKRVANGVVLFCISNTSIYNNLFFIYDNRKTYMYCYINNILNRVCGVDISKSQADIAKNTLKKVQKILKISNIIEPFVYNYNILDVDKKEVTFETIEPQLSQLIRKKSKGEELIVLLHADKTLNLQDVVSVIDIGNKLKVKMVLFTQKEKK